MAAKPTYEALELRIEELERKAKKLTRTEVKLKQKITELNSFINNVPDMAWLKDRKSRFIAVNKTFGEAVGMNPGSLINQTCEVCFGKEAAKKFREDDQEVMKGEKQVTIVEKIKDSKKNEEVWLETIKSPIFNESGQVSGTVGIARDITHRKQAEEALMESKKNYRRLVEMMNDGFGIQDEKGAITYVNSKFCQMLGYKPENLIGKPVTDFLDDRNKQILKNQISIRKKGEVLPYEIEWISKDGKNFPTIMSPQVIFNDNGQFNGSFSVITDISILKQVEKELLKTQDELENRVAERTKELRIQKSNLEEANIALQVLLDKRQEDKKEMEDNLLTNVKEMIAPYFEKIRKTKLNDQQKAILSILESFLNEIISPFARKISLKYLNLTPTEIEVANLIRHGINSKEIADIMNLSPRTIYNHRKNIRKKFGLDNKKTNLRSHLLLIY